MVDRVDPTAQPWDEDELFYEYKHAVFDDIVSGVDHRAVLNEDEDRVRRQVTRLLEQVAEERPLANGQPLDAGTTERLIRDFVSELIGFGPLDVFLHDPDVSRIEVNEPDDVWVERGGRLGQTTVRFRDQEHLLSVAQRMADRLRARLDESSPSLRRTVGASVQLEIPPLRAAGTRIQIDKGRGDPFDDLGQSQVEPAGLAARFEAIQAQLEARAIGNIDAATAGGDLDLLRAEIEDEVRAGCRALAVEPSAAELSQMVQGILDEMRGLGPLEPLLQDPEVSEIMVNRWDRIYEKRCGKLRPSEVRFRDDAHVVRTIERILAPRGGRLDRTSPSIRTWLVTGPAARSRVYAVIPPLAVDGPCLTIQKPGPRLGLRDLIDFGVLTREVADFLAACVEGRLNVVVCGGWRSGRTTLLNTLTRFIGSDERTVSVEEVPELELAREHVVRLLTRPPTAEAEGEVTLRDLVVAAQQMSPDRIIVGECRGAEALELLQAMSTGCQGCMTTAHANSPRELLQRIENMVMMARTDLPHRAIREQIEAAVDLIVQVSRLEDGRRKVVEIDEVTGMYGDVVCTQSVFLYDRYAERPLPTGIRPACYKRIMATEHGQNLPRDTFDRREDTRTRY